eukprot:1157254-Pelagomonas_calceolata.AAC.6
MPSCIPVSAHNRMRAETVSKPVRENANAKYQANEANHSMADHQGSQAHVPLSQIFRLAKEEKREHATDTSVAPTPAPKLIYLSNLQNALKSYTHTNHRKEKKKKRKKLLAPSRMGVVPCASVGNPSVWELCLLREVGYPGFGREDFLAPCLESQR